MIVDLADSRVRFKLWVLSSSGEDIMGDGRWHLLKAIDQKGSLMAASEHLGISYRKAWGSLRKAESHLGFPIVKKQRGGKQGGKTFLTDEGRRLMKAYDDFFQECDTAVSKAFTRLKEELTNEE